MSQSTSKLVTATGQIIKGRPATITCLSVALVAAASKLEVFDNEDGSGTAVFQVDGTQNVCHAPLEIRMQKIYVKVTGGAKYNITYN